LLNVSSFESEPCPSIAPNLDASATLNPNASALDSRRWSLGLGSTML
jgi:hypothetical protein